MDIECADQTGSVDHRESTDLEEFGKRFHTDATLIQDKVCSVPDGWGEHATPRLTARSDRESLDEVCRRSVIATVLCGGLELGAVLGNGHYVNGNLSGFATHPHSEPVFEEPLHHGTPHYCHALRRLRFRVDRIAVRRHLVRKALDRRWPSGLVHEVGCTICKCLIRLLDEAGKPPTGHTQSARRTIQDGPRLRTVALFD